MTFSYSNDPSVTPKDAFRFYLNDTIQTDSYFTDEEIAYLIAQWGPNIFDVCRAGAETLEARFTRLADSTSKSVGDISVSTSYASKAVQFRALADSFLARRLRKSRPAPAFNADAMKNTADRTTTSNGTDFVVGQMDNPESSPEISGY
jgi:hypothetical protein